MADTWLTIEQAAITLGLSTRTVNRHITGGKLPSRLKEGRREVLVQLPDTGSRAGVNGGSPNGSLYAAHAPPTHSNGAHSNGAHVSTNGALASANTASSPTATRVASGSVSEGPGAVGQTAPTSQASNGASNTPGAPHPDPGHTATSTTASNPPTDSSRAATTDPTHGEARSDASQTHVLNEPEYDVDTVLALAASDKADLAVAAYQTLARMAEQQTQTLRRGAYVAWGMVGVMVIGVAVAIGWASHRLAQAESDSRKAAEAAGQVDQLTQRLSAAEQAAARAQGEVSGMKTQVQLVKEAMKTQQQQAPATRPATSWMDRLAGMLAD